MSTSRVNTVTTPKLTQRLLYIMFRGRTNLTATATVLDRTAHHPIMLEYDVLSYRTNATQNRGTEQGPDRPE